MEPTDSDDLLERALEIVQRALKLPRSRRTEYIRGRSPANGALLQLCLELLRKDGEDDFDFTGHSIGNYDILGRMPESGQADVYRGVRRNPKQKVAVKMIRFSTDDKPALQRFEREKEILAALEHDGIVSYFDHGEIAGGWHYFVMELVEGADLVTHCRVARLTIRQRLALFLRLLAAVEYFHQRYLHRDLKPKNIMVTTDGRVKVLDFGSAQAPSTDVVGTFHLDDLTGFHSFTEEYASPEQLRGDPVKSTSDIYQLGVILFELLAGCRPFPREGKTRGKYCNEVSTLPPPTASSVAQGDTALAARCKDATDLRGRLKGDLDHILSRALATAPSDRYPAVGKFADDIQRYLNDEPVDATLKLTKVAGAYRLRKFLCRYSLVSGLTFGLFLALATALFVTWRRNVTLEERNRALQVVAILPGALSVENARVQAETMAALAARRQLEDNVAGQAAQLKVLTAQAMAQTVRDQASLFEAIGDRFSQAATAGGLGSEGNQVVTKGGREIYAFARERWEAAGDPESARRLSEKILSLGGSNRGQSLFDFGSLSLPQGALIDVAQTQLVIARLDEATGDLKAATQSYERIGGMLSTIPKENPKASHIRSEAAQQLERLHLQPGEKGHSK